MEIRGFDQFFHGNPIPMWIYDREDSSTIGMTLINLLKKQLEGNVHFSNKEGTKFRLEFEKADVKGIGSSLAEN